MPRKRIVFSKSALFDLHEIETYIAARSPTGAANVINSIHKSISYLETNPLLGFEERNGNGRLLVEARYRYVISYGVTGDEVQIRYVFHPRQNWRDNR